MGGAGGPRALAAASAAVALAALVSACGPLPPPTPGGERSETPPREFDPTTPSPPSSPLPPPVLRPAPDLDVNIIDGADCATVETIAWRARGAAIELGDTGIVATAPSGWTVAFPRPDVAVLSGPPAPGRPRATIELINAPACATYDSEVVHRRLAIRSLIDLFGAGDAAFAFDHRTDWVGRLAPPSTSVIRGGNLSVGAKTVPVVAYYTEIGSGSNLVVVFAAACDGFVGGDSDCQRAYHTLVNTAVTP